MVIEDSGFECGGEVIHRNYRARLVGTTLLVGALAAGAMSPTDHEGSTVDTISVPTTIGSHEPRLALGAIDISPYDELNVVRRDERQREDRRNFIAFVSLVTSTEARAWLKALEPHVNNFNHSGNSVLARATRHQSASTSDAAFLACTRGHESDTAGGYRAVSPNGLYFGAYQFLTSTWDKVAQHAGRPELVGVRPDHASPTDQDAIALDLYHWQGKAPWKGRC